MKIASSLDNQKIVKAGFGEECEFSKNDITRNFNAIRYISSYVGDLGEVELSVKEIAFAVCKEDIEGVEGTGGILKIGDESYRVADARHNDSGFVFLVCNKI